MTVVLDQPAGTVKLPVGSYSLDEIWLRKGEIEVRQPQRRQGDRGRATPGQPRCGRAFDQFGRSPGPRAIRCNSITSCWGRTAALISFPGRTTSIRRSSRCSRAPTGWRPASSNMAEAAPAAYSWRVPFTNTTQVTVVSYANLGGLGAREGIPVVHTWEPPPPEPPQMSAAASASVRVLLWLLMLLPLFLFRPNRSRQGLVDLAAGHDQRLGRQSPSPA